MPGHLPPVGSVWAIQDTANHTVSIARGLLEAATSDDVNPVALVCCASFGAVLPVATDTRLKIEQLARRNHTSHVLKFIKAQIGYKRDDSVEQLSRSDPGIRFLCLCATLCTLDQYEAAERLDAMLQATQKENQLRPTVKQLQVMMTSLKNKLAMSDFATSVAGFEILIRSRLASLDEAFTIEIAQVPSKSSLQDLILVMNEIGRVGEADATDSFEVKLRPHYAPWTCAFVKWLLGVPPEIKTSTGVSILSQQHALIVLTIVPDATNPVPRKRPFDAVDRSLAVVTRQKLKTLRELVFHEPTDDKRRAWQGLVSAQAWFRYHFGVVHARFPELERDAVLKGAVSQALGYIVKYVPERLLLCDDVHSLKIALSKHDATPTDVFSDLAPTPFLDRETRCIVADNLTKEYIDLTYEEFEPSGILVPQNLSQRVSGACRSCSEAPNPMLAGTLSCRVHELLEAIGTIGSMLLVLTLFGLSMEAYPMLTAGVKFHTTRFHTKLWQDKDRQILANSSFSRLITASWQSLMHGKCSVLSCPPIAIFKFTAEMMGHEKIWDSTVISSKSGQVLFPAFFEASGFMREGYLQLCSFPGRLLKDGMEFNFLIDQTLNNMHADDISNDETDGDGSYTEDVQAVLDVASHVASAGANDQNDEADLLNEADEAAEEDEGVDEGEASDDEHNEAIPDARQETERKQMPRNFSHTARPGSIAANAMQWKVSIQDDTLHGELRLIGHDSSDETRWSSQTPVCAWPLVECLPRSRLTLPCSHSPRRTAGALADEFEMHAGPPMARSMEWPRALFDTKQSYVSQLIGLEAQDYWPPIVVNVDGCVRCALQLCLDIPTHTVVA